MEHKHRDPRSKELRAEADIELRNFVLEKFHESALSIPQLAERVAELLGEPVSVSRLYSFTASTKVSARLPAYFLPALCEALDSDAILLHLARRRLRKEVEFAETVRELRRICEELPSLQKPNTKRSARHA